VNDLFAKIKRLLEPRPRPAESAGEPTAERPPPRAVEPIRAETPPPAQAAEPIRAEEPPAPAAEPIRADAPPAPPPAEPIRAEPSPVQTPPHREPASLALDDLAEVRAALEAVGEASVPEVESEAEAPPIPASPPAAKAAPSAAPTADRAATAAVAERVGDALILTLGTPPTTFTVAKSSATLGRGQENTIRLDDLSVSRRHARIAYRQGGYWLSDLGSMGGTWVNGTRLNAPRRIASGEVIDIGLCRLTVSITGGAAKAAPKKSVTKPR
jgi:hypothetical protein